ncbi:hypothetical protein [Rhodococcus sp. WAY2]|uniref:hypothetical protein n=1 Tax=Rhodococcus sp. WAY2 TaxID=2663121 RepID=UPI00131F8E83|nr:hypothetical protein [Rhodococcus sp. WAY2]QHE73529.1 hypothetical protein GFS60_07189 [Rhodococcus sp. WAY2]
MRTWAAPGVRADPAERERRRRSILARRNQDALTAWLSAEEGLRMWQAGRLVPDRITAALDMSGLEGPQVDIDCGTTEPDVDRWELGIKYPTWEQFLALCRLTATPISFFFREPSDLRASETTLVYHLAAKVLRELDRTPVTAFTREAIAATLAGRDYTPVPAQDTLW